MLLKNMCDHSITMLPMLFVLMFAATLSWAYRGPLLVQAAAEGNLIDVKRLVEEGADVDHHFGQPLKLAAGNGHVEIVNYLLGAGANPNGSNHSAHYLGQALTEAAKNNRLEIVNILLKAGVPVNLPNRFTWPLREASGNGHLELVHRLIEVGANLDYQEGGAMLLAIEKGHLDVVKALIAAGADVNAANKFILVEAASNGYVEIVKKLIDAGVKNEYIGDAILFAAAFAHLDIVKLLIEYDQNPSYDKIIAFVASSGNIELIKSIIKTGVKPESLNQALSAAAFHGHLDAVQLMLQTGADPNYVGVLKKAALSGNIEVVRFLLESGSNITCEGSDSACPWHYAAMAGNPNIVALFADNGADINEPLTEDTFKVNRYEPSSDAKGWTVMHIAARHGSPIAGKLLDLGTDINALDAKGRTPLQVAIQHRKLIVVKELLTFCPDLSSTNKKGETALDMAKNLALSNTTDNSEFQFTMDVLKESLKEEISTTPSNEQGIRALRDQFLALMEANSTLNESLTKSLKDNVDIHRHIYSSVKRLLDERAQQNTANIIEDHKCKTSLSGTVTVAMGTEYLSRCECVPGQGPKMTFTLLAEANLCGNNSSV